MFIVLQHVVFMISDAMKNKQTLSDIVHWGDLYISFESTPQLWMTVYSTTTPFPQPKVSFNSTVTEHRWNTTDTRKSKYLEKSLSQCEFPHQKSHTDWPGIEPGPPQWQAHD
jgi:hypothetical protein